MSIPFQASVPAIKHRGVHLDLKGTPPNFPRLLELLELFSALRFTAVFVEWEDAFPWSVDLSFRSATAYTEDEVRQFVAHAKHLGLELIPLVQTLGHMENFLKGDDRIALREVPADNDALNPLAPGANELVQEIILDVLRLMPNVKHFHLGGDEAWAFGTHPQTKAYIEQHGASTLYLSHAEPLLCLLNQRNIRPILWHDMMVKWDDASLNRLAPQCDLVVWGYGGHPDHVEHHYSSRHSARFAQLGFSLWGASAFKGADNHSGDRPNPDERRVNAKAWVEIAQRHDFTGLITTGWSRYCFNAPQCESIEACLDTLLEQAILMYDGTAPEDTIERSGELLAQIWSPEQARQFIRVRDAATEYTGTSLDVWYRVRLIETQLATCRLDPHKRPISMNFRQISRELEKLEAATRAFREALAPLIPAHWLNQYFSERNTPLLQLLKPYIPAAAVEMK